MGIGASLFLIAAGAILAFGVNADAVGWINVDVIGWILMAVGALGLIVTMFIWGRRRRVVEPAVTSEPTVVDDPPTTYNQPVSRTERLRERDYRTP